MGPGNISVPPVPPVFFGSAVDKGVSGKALVSAVETGVSGPFCWEIPFLRWIWKITGGNAEVFENKGVVEKAIRKLKKTKGKICTRQMMSGVKMASWWRAEMEIIARVPAICRGLPRDRAEERGRAAPPGMTGREADKRGRSEGRRMRLRWRTGCMSCPG